MTLEDFIKIVPIVIALGTGVYSWLNGRAARDSAASTATTASATVKGVSDAMGALRLELTRYQLETESARKQLIDAQANADARLRELTEQFNIERGMLRERADTARLEKTKTESALADLTLRMTERTQHITALETELSALRMALSALRSDYAALSLKYATLENDSRETVTMAELTSAQLEQAKAFLRELGLTTNQIADLLNGKADHAALRAEIVRHFTPPDNPVQPSEVTK